MAVITIDDTTVTGSGTAPNAPTNLTIEPEWDSIRLHWDNPTNRDLDYIQIWRSTTNVRSAATMVAQVKANDYNDHSLETGTRYYWIRAINTVGLTSDYLPNTSTTTISGIPEQVAVTSAADRDLLQYDSATSSWVNGALRDNTLIKGALQSTTNSAYSFLSPALTGVTSNNGVEAASSFPSGTQGYGAQGSFIHYFGDTLAAANTSAVFAFRTANGNSVTGTTVPFTGIASVAPSAVVSTNTLGGLNFNGYSTTNFSDMVGSTNQGGAVNAIHALQAQGYANETFSDSTLTLTSTNVTAVASSFASSLTTPTVTGTRGQISFGAITLAVGQAIRVSGTLSGDATGIVSGQDYYIVVTNGTTTATLSATPGGVPITTSGSTLTGLTLRRCSVTFTMTGQTSVPFGRGAKVAVSGVNNVTDGTYAVWGTPTTSGMSIGIPWTFGSTPTVSGSQSFSCTTAYMGSGWRVRGYGSGIPANVQNRVNFVDHNATTANYRADTFNIAGGAYGDTSTTRLQVDSTKITASLPVVFPSMDTTARNLLTALAGMVIFNTTTVKLECYDGTTWQALF